MLVLFLSKAILGDNNGFRVGQKLSTSANGLGDCTAPQS